MAQIEIASETVSELRELLEERTQQLKATLARFHNVIDRNADALIIVDERGITRFANSAAESLFGLSTHGLQGHEFGFPVVPGEATEIELPPDEEGPRIAEMRATETEWDGQMAYLASLREITQQKRAEEERKSLEQQLFHAQKLQSLSTLAGGVAHDFNNLLTGIICLTELALRRLEPGSEVYDLIAKIPEQGRRAAHLIGSLMAFGRRTPTERKPLALVPLFKETVKIIRHALPEDIEVRVTWSDDLGLVGANPTQIQQIIMNLVTNARDAMPDGGELFLEVSRAVLDEEYCRHFATATPGEYVCVTVRDTGMGIPPEVQQRIFEPFYTTKEAGEGTGLGLAMVYGIVQDHSGHIHVYSEVGQGSVFKVYLPTLDGEVSHEPDMAREGVAGSGETVLVVEDDLVVLGISEAMLHSLGYNVVTATNGKEALYVHRTRGDEIALVLSDLTMPEMSGDKLFEELTKVDPDVSMLIMSGYAVEDRVAALQGKGLKGFVQKPLDLQRLGQAVRKGLDEQTL